MHSLPISTIIKGTKECNSLQIDNVVVNGIPIYNAVIVGLLMEIQLNEESRIFEAVINDTTGQIQVISHLHDHEFPLWLKVIHQLNPTKPVYVRAIIQPKQFLENIAYKCEFMEIINDSNQIITHLMDCMVQHKQRQQHNQVSTVQQEYQDRIIEAFEDCRQLQLTAEEICIKAAIPEVHLQNCLLILQQNHQLNVQGDNYSLI